MSELTWGFIDPETGDFIGVTEAGMRQRWGWLGAIALGRIKAIASHYKDESKAELRSSMEAIYKTAEGAYDPDDHAGYRVVPKDGDPLAKALAEVGLPEQASINDLIRHHRNNQAVADGFWEVAFHGLEAKYNVLRERGIDVEALALNGTVGSEDSIDAAWAAAEAALPDRTYRIMLWESLGSTAAEERYVAKVKHPRGQPMPYHYGPTPAAALRAIASTPINNGARS